MDPKEYFKRYGKIYGVYYHDDSPGNFSDYAICFHDFDLADDWCKAPFYRHDFAAKELMSRPHAIWAVGERCVNLADRELENYEIS